MHDAPPQTDPPGLHRLAPQQFLELVVSRRELRHAGVRDDPRVSEYAHSVLDPRTGELYVSIAPSGDEVPARRA